MGSYLYLVLLLIAGSGFYWFSKGTKKTEEEDYSDNTYVEPVLTERSVPEVSTLTETHVQSPNPILTISVFAKPESHFASYDLLQAISAMGMQFGEMNIFHYYHRNAQGKKIILFSLASATKPGEFDLDRIGSFSCVGLTFFMDATQVPNPLQAYNLMVNTAEQLAEDLGGELRASPQTPWREEFFQEGQQKILQLQV